MEIFKTTIGGFPTISNNEEMLNFINTGINEIIEDVSALWGEYDENENDENDEEEDEDYSAELIINKKKEDLLKIIHYWITTQNNEITTQGEMIDEKQIIGNSHKNYISHPNCKQCKGSIGGKCVKHGG